MVFKAENTGAYISINGKRTEIENITEQKTPSKGVVIISEEKAIYLPNYIDDLKNILDFLTKFVDAIPSSTLQPNPEWPGFSEIFKEQLRVIKEALK